MAARNIVRVGRSYPSSHRARSCGEVRICCARAAREPRSSTPRSRTRTSNVFFGVAISVVPLRNLRSARLQHKRASLHKETPGSEIATTPSGMHDSLPAKLPLADDRGDDALENG